MWLPLPQDSCPRVSSLDKRSLCLPQSHSVQTHPGAPCPSPPVTLRGCDSGSCEGAGRLLTGTDPRCILAAVAPGAAAVPHWLVLSTELFFNPPESISRALQGTLGSSLSALGPSLPVCWACWLHPVRRRDVSPGRPGGGFSASSGPTRFADTQQGVHPGSRAGLDSETMGFRGI